MDSCFALVGVHQHGIAVTRQSYERTKQCIKGPLLTRRVQSIHLSASSTQHMAGTARLCGMDFISDDDAKTDLVQQPLFMERRLNVVERVVNNLVSDVLSAVLL